MPNRLYVLLFLTSHVGVGQQLMVCEDKRLPAPDSVLVFAPHEYRSDARYPVVFLLHGWSGNYKQWNTITDLKLAATKHKFIIVCPDGFYNSWYVNSPIVETSQFQSFFFDNLLPRVFSSWRVDTTNVFISGLSMGGFGAVSLFLSRPDLFKAAGSTSGILDLSRFADKFDMHKVLGQYSESRRNYDALSLMTRVQNASLVGKTIIIDCGTDDPAYGANQAFYDRCKALKINAMFISQPGSHSREYWRKSIQQHLFMFSQLVKQE